MKIRLVVHLDVADGQPLWWAESPDVPGFTAADRHLRGLRRRTGRALRAIAADRGWSLPLDLVLELAPPFEPETDNPPAAAAAVPPPLSAADGRARQVGPVVVVAASPAAASPAA